MHVSRTSRNGQPSLGSNYVVNWTRSDLGSKRTRANMNVASNTFLDLPLHCGTIPAHRLGCRGSERFLPDDPAFERIYQAWPLYERQLKVAMIFQLPTI